MEDELGGSFFCIFKGGWAWVLGLGVFFLIVNFSRRNLVAIPVLKF